MFPKTQYNTDIIDIEGGGLNDELYPDDVNQPCFIACSDGSVFRVIYDDDGIWRITVLFQGTLYDHKIEKDTFDEVYLQDGVKWIVGGVTMIKI
jgi:hypothetical protein